MRSFKVQSKAAKAGFDWDSIDGAWQKLFEEIKELEEAEKANDQAKMEDELGDLLFAVVNVSRFMNIQPELALTGTIEKFIRRFSGIEGMAAKEGKTLEDMTLQEMDSFWNKVKESEVN